MHIEAGFQHKGLDDVPTVPYRKLIRFRNALIYGHKSITAEVQWWSVCVPHDAAIEDQKLVQNVIFSILVEMSFKNYMPPDSWGQEVEGISK